MKPRNTKIKELVTSTFVQTRVPLSIEEVYLTVQKNLPRTAYSTIYRIIQKFVAEGKLLVVDWRERSAHFEWAAKDHHHHLVCNDCGKITDVDDALLHFNIDDVEARTGFSIKDHSIELFGECVDCQEK